MDIKMVKRFFCRSMPRPPQNTKWTYNWMVTPLDIPIQPIACPEQALSFISNVIVVTRCVKGSLF